jgi:hypothetical protein
MDSSLNFAGAGTGSGGTFAWGNYVNGDRSLQLHYRHALGLVSYSIGDCSLSHEEYLRFLGVYGQNSYPDFPADPVDSFHSLARDIELYCGDFLHGSGQQFLQFAEELKLNPKKVAQLP